MTTAAPSGEFLSIVVGYDGSPPASRALNGAVRLLRGRVGRIEVVWVAHLSSTVMMSAAAVAEMEESFDELAPEMRDQAAGQLDGLGLDWGFERRQGIIADELIAAASGLADARPGQTVVIVVGSSSHVSHRMVGSVTVSLARHSPVPVVIVPQASPDLNRSREFMSAVFGWQMSRDGQPRTVTVIRVDALEPSIARVREHGGRLVVEPFTLPGVGHGCYVTDPAGVLIGLHAYDPEA